MNKDDIKIFSWTSFPEFAKKICTQAWQTLSLCEIKKFSCWETYVRLWDSVRWKEVFIIQTIREWVSNDDFMELFLLCEAAKQSFAKTIHIIVPHFWYSRQDKIHAPRECISAKLMARLLETSWADEMITVNLHSDQHQWFFNIPVDNINLTNLFVKEIQNRNIKDPIIVSPDAGWAKSAKKFADKIWAPIAILHKTRPEHNIAEISHIIWNVEWKTPIIFDDIIDTAGSVCSAKQVLINHWSKSDIYLVATHPVFSGPAIWRIKEAKFKEIIVSDTLPLDWEKKLPEITQISCSWLIAQIIINIAERKSVSQLYLS